MSEKIEAVLRQLEEVNEMNEIDEKIKNMDVDESMSNLYIILLQYYHNLTKKNHEKINLITECMDDLILLKKSDIQKNKKIKVFDIIHSKTYNNIQEIYNYDKEREISTDTETESDI